MPYGVRWRALHRWPPGGAWATVAYGAGVRGGPGGRAPVASTSTANPGGRRWIVGLLLIAFLALAGRVVYVLVVTSDLPPTFSMQATGLRRSFDELYYLNSATLLADGEGFDTPLFASVVNEQDATHPPLTAVTLAPVAWLTDGSELAMRLAVAAVGTGVVVLVGLIAQTVAGDQAGLAAAALAAIYPNLWVNDGLVMSETFAALGTAATLLAVYRLARHPSVPAAALTGTAAGIAMLSRSELALLLPLLVLPVVLFARVDRRRRIVLAGSVVAAASLIVAPWVVHNLSRFEEPVLLSHGDGDVLSGANCDATYGGELFGFWDGTCGLLDEHHEPSIAARLRRERALTYISEHFDRLPAVMAARVGRVWSAYRPAQSVELAEGEGKPSWATWSGFAMYWALVPLAVAGAWSLRRRRDLLFPLVSGIVLVTLSAAAFYGLVRFRVPAEISIVVLAGVTIADLLTRDDAGERVGLVETPVAVSSGR